MYVIQGTFPVNTFGTNLVTDVFTVPADKCVWKVIANGDGYSLSTAFYVQGTTETAIATPQFGHVGKTGRFVKHTI